uniref:Uncharacterized protein n=1 Tax=Tanacetum cinerariifolium TaxID=118510 RepID=A0A6L2NCD2_TANCI|nr:hypothetical protein [Tanacetum cinerariifolium]
MPKEDEVSILCLQQKSETISSMLLGKEREFKCPSLMSVAELGTYIISYVQTNEAKGQMANKFLKQKELLSHMLKGKEEGALRQSNELQARITPTLRTWRLYLSREVGKEGSGVGLVAFAGKGMKDLHVFIDLKILDDQVKGSRNPTMKEARKYKEEIMDAATLFHRSQITYLPKKLNSKAEVLTGLATINLVFLNQEVLVGIKTRPLIEVGSDDKEGISTSKEGKVKTQKLWRKARGGVTAISSFRANNSDEQQRRGENTYQ